uniref:Uncharacterized protein n=1 Tax=Molossus molossus TaxID=27622 RepID=A0A7J8BKM7_MOLMO|nr:hypothetical protein HJG59_010163 [Molossus molossus]
MRDDGDWSWEGTEELASNVLVVELGGGHDDGDPPASEPPALRAGCSWGSLQLCAKEGRAGGVGAALQVCHPLPPASAGISGRMLLRPQLLAATRRFPTQVLGAPRRSRSGLGDAEDLSVDGFQRKEKNMICSAGTGERMH